MKHLALMLVVAVLLGGLGATASKVASQPVGSPPASPVSAPVTAGDWTFQLLDVERRDSYYAEHSAKEFEPEGVYLIVGVAITWNGTSPTTLDAGVTSAWFKLTDDTGVVYEQASNVFSQFGVEQSYRTDTPYPLVSASGGTAEPGTTYYSQYIFDVPPDATDVALISGPLSPAEFSIPLPDLDTLAGQDEWELDVLDATRYDTLGPPLTGDVRAAGGTYLVVDVRLTRLVDEWAAIDGTWFALRTEDGQTIPIDVDATIDLGIPIESEGLQSHEFSLAFDVPVDVVEAPLTLITTPGAPLNVEIPLDPNEGTLPSPTPSPTPASTATAVPTPRPTATTAPTMAPSPTPTATPRPTATPTPTLAPTALPTESREPGAIQVVSSDGSNVAPAAGGAVEIILDTSGSMLQPMGDALRIDVAKDVLTDVVTTQIPAGTQTAMRVFGTVPGSCDTSLAIPLGPLDPAAAASTVAGIEAINEVRTPLGASLEAAGTDLREVDGPRLIVLITDGEETCGGDPGTVISGLAALGVDVRVNIVGFAIDDPQIEATLTEWAEHGGGEYFSASDAEDLGPALNQALQPTYEVQDSDGFTVGDGIVNGEAIPVPPGRYTVIVDTTPPTTIEVVVEPGETTVVDLDDGED